MSGISGSSNTTIRFNSSCGRFVTRLKNQELEIARLKEKCLQLTVRMQWLERWKEGIEKWIMEQFGPDFSVGSDAENEETFSLEANDGSNDHQDDDLHSDGDGNICIEEEEMIVPQIIQVIGSAPFEPKDATVLADPVRNNVEEEEKRHQNTRRASTLTNSANRNDAIGDDSDCSIVVVSPPIKRMKCSSEGELEVAVTSITSNGVGAATVANGNKASSLENVADQGFSTRKSKPPPIVVEIEDESEEEPEMTFLNKTSNSRGPEVGADSDASTLDSQNENSNSNIEKIKSDGRDGGTLARNETNRNQDPFALETHRKGSLKTKPQRPTVSSQESMPMGPEASCAVCGYQDVGEDNTIIFCDICKMAVHQVCYGVVQIDKCNPCAKRLDPSKLPCELCPNLGGALKPVFSSSKRRTRWAHVWCAWWVPEVKMGNPKSQEPVVGIEDIPKARKNLKCTICHTIGGAPIQCAVDGGIKQKRCTIAFHATCARDAGLRMDTADPGGDQELRCKAYCRKHTNFGK